MCDYSLSIYQTRPARVGETYVTHRFPTGAVGLTSPGQESVAVCVACDTRMSLSDIPVDVRDRCIVSGEEDATFVQLDGRGFRDAVRFGNGQEVTLQRLGPGVRVTIIASVEEQARPLVGMDAETL